jgi:phosphoenolpyruvate carboxylase
MKWKEGQREIGSETQRVFLFNSDQAANCGTMATFQLLKGNSMFAALIA